MDTDTLTVRATTAADAATLVALTQAAYAAGHAQTGLYGYVYDESAAWLIAELRRSEWRTLLAEDAGEPVGCVRINASLPGVIKLGRLAVHPDHQGRGVGSFLVDVVERWAAAWGRQRVTLGVLEAAPANRAIYEHWGYTVVGRREMRREPGNFYTLMEKQIEPRHDDPTIARYEQLAPSYTARQGNVRPWTQDALQRFAAVLPAPARVLEIGCGPGFDGYALREHGYTVLGLDRTWAFLQIAAARVPTRVQADNRALPLGAGSVDGVWANASLLHLPRCELVIALSEIRRVLHDDGALYLSLKQGTGTAFTDGRHFTFYQPDELNRALRGASFEIQQQSISADHRPTMPPWIVTLARAFDGTIG